MLDQCLRVRGRCRDEISVELSLGRSSRKISDQSTSRISYLRTLAAMLKAHRAPRDRVIHASPDHQLAVL